MSMQVSSLGGPGGGRYPHAPKGRRRRRPPVRMADRIGELLVHRDLISLAQLQRAQQEQRAFGKRLTTILLRLGFITERQLAGFLAEHYKVPYFDFAAHEIEPEVLRLVDRSIAAKHLAVPVQRAGSKLIVAMADPNNMLAIDDLKFHTGLNIDAVVSLESAIEQAIARYYDRTGAPPSYGEVLGGLGGLEPAASIPAERERPTPSLSESEQTMAGRLCEAILRNALAKGASDVHIEPYEKGMRVRYRIDGTLHHEMDPPLGYGASLVGKFKQQAGLDVGDRRQPLEGRLRFKAGKDREVAFHVVTLPTVFGEAMRLRLLDRAALPADLGRTGLDGEPLRLVRAALHRAHGMVLVAGPAGAGKSTTLCTAIGELSSDSVRITTVEEPVEYHLQGVSQVQVDGGLSFAAAVRAVLRQDPDVVMVSELRDYDTAELCARAAAAGRRVLAAVPAGDAAAAFLHLVHLGVEPHLIAAATSLVLAQRLVRRLCLECAEPDPACSVQRLVDAGVPQALARDGRPRRARGCRACHGGFRGRTAIFEVMPIGEALRERIAEGAGVAELRTEAIRLGMRPLRLAGLARVLDGTVSFDEVLRATAD